MGWVEELSTTEFEEGGLRFPVTLSDNVVLFAEYFVKCIFGNMPTVCCGHLLLFEHHGDKHIHLKTEI